MRRQTKIAFSVSSVISAKTGINYPYLKPGNEFCNRVRVPSSCYKSLVGANLGFCIGSIVFVQFLCISRANTHRRRRRDETVLSRRRCVHEFATSSRRLPTDSAM